MKLAVFIQHLQTDGSFLVTQRWERAAEFVPPLSTKLQARALTAVDVDETLLGKASLTLNIYINRTHGRFPP